MYKNPVAAHARVIPHVYVNATDDMAAYQADLKGLQAVTAAMMAEPEFADVAFYLFSEEMYDFTGEGFVGCDAVDPRVDGTAVDIWTTTSKCFSNRSPDHRVFVHQSKLVPAILARRCAEKVAQ